MHIFLCSSYIILFFWTGSKKRKELHGTTRANALSGTWGENLDGAVFQAYKLDFQSNLSGDAYSSFSLLIESTLAGDVGNVEMDLYLVRRFIKASVSPCGQIRLSQEEVCNLPHTLVPMGFYTISCFISSYLCEHADGQSKVFSAILLQWHVWEVVCWIQVTGDKERVFASN